MTPYKMGTEGEHFETLSNFLRCAKGAVEMLKTYGMFREGPKEWKGKRRRGWTFRKTSHRTDAVVSHTGTHSQRYVITASCSFSSLVLTKILPNDYKILSKGGLIPVLFW